MLAVFHGHGRGLFSSWLHRDFRHVFVCVRTDTHWVRIDAMAGVPTADVVVPADRDLAAFYRDCGFTVIETLQADAAPLGPLALANCVGLAKAMLGRRFWAVTPKQLHDALVRERMQ